MEKLFLKLQETFVKSALMCRISDYFLPSLWCLILVLPATFHLFDSPLFVGHDYTHVGRITEMVNTLNSGQFPPRWSQNLGFGYGMPLFSFYAPLPYYLGSLLVLLGISASTSVALLFFLSTWGSSIAMFYLVRNGGKQFLVPLVSAALFTYLPYRAVDIYVRGALGELWGIWLLVVALLTLQNVFRTPSFNRAVLFALSLALFFLSHNLMMLMGLPLILAVIAAQLGKPSHTQKSILKYIVFGTSLGIGMAAFFLFPMYFEKQHTSVDELSSIAGGYAQHFVYWKQLFFSEFKYGGSIEGIHDGISFSLGAAGWLVILSSIAMGVKLFKKSRKKLLKSDVFFWILIVIATLFLTSQKSQLIWNIFGQMSFLQFPWRFLSLALLVLPLLFSSTMYSIQSKQNAKVLSVVIFALLLFEVQNFKPNPETKYSSVASIANQGFISTDLSKTIPDYIHPNLSAIVTDAKKKLDPPASRFETIPPTLLAIQKDSASIAQAVVPPTSQPTTIRANIFNFPGWQWKIEGVKVPHTVASDLPVMEYMLPPSSIPRILSVSWSETALRKVTNITSAISWVFVIVYGMSQTLKFFALTMKRSLSRP